MKSCVFRARFALLVVAAASCALHAAEFPQWGRDNSRNMVSDEKGLPTAIDPGKAAGGDGAIDPKSTRNVRWVAKLGSAAYGNPTVAGGRVFVGTNNASPRLKKYAGDHGILMCLDEKSGAFLWELAVPKLKAGKANDWEQVGLCSSPTVDGDRVYVVTNRCQVVCVTAAGRGSEAEVLWHYDMREELGVFPHNMTSSSVLVWGDRLFVTTSNGVDWTGKHLPAPDAPALICLDKKSGALLGRERSGISSRTWVCNWSSPALGRVGGKDLLVFGGGDGFCYGFDPTPSATSEADGVGTLREIWRCDCNPAEHRIRNGQAIKYGLPEGPSEVLATPVILDGRVYVPVGQEPEQGDGAGCLNCIDASKSGDISKTGIVWRSDQVGRSVSTVSIVNGLLYIADFAGVVRCLDATNGTLCWAHDTEAHIWGCTMIVDGKVYVGNESGILTVLAAGRDEKLIASLDLKDPIYSTPIAANGALFLATQSQLYVLEKKE